MTLQKKRNLSDSLFIEEGEDEEVVAHDVDNYLGRLFTLLLAYAMADCAGVTGAPEPAQEERSEWVSKFRESTLTLA